MTKVMAHRGWSAVAPENTLPAFAAALELGADGVELDVQLSSDGQVVVLHDERLERTSNGQGLVGEHSLAELRQLDAGSWFSDQFRQVRIPLLAEVLELCRPVRCGLNIELKNGLVHYPGLEERVLQLIADYPGPVVISSFNHRSLQRVHQLNSDLELGVLYVEHLFQPWVYARSCGSRALHPYFPTVDEELVSACRNTGLRLRPWTVDEPTVQQRLLAWGVDAIITNHPDRLLRLRESSCDGQG